MLEREEPAHVSRVEERRPTVVLADDHPAVLLAFGQLLAASCDVVASVPNGCQAVEAVTSLKPDVLVVDLMMPDLDGLEVCRRVRVVSPGTAVVIVTAFHDAQVRKVAIRDGASDFVSKVHASDHLEAAIQRIAAARLAS